MVQSGQSFSSSVPTKLCLLCTNKVHIIWWSYLRDFSLEYLLTYKKRIYFFWKSSIAVAGNQTRIVWTEVKCIDHYTITTWMRVMGSMDHFIPHKLLVLMIFGQWPHHGLWPLTSNLLQNDIGKNRPKACYFQWNSWKIWSNYFRAASLRSFLTSDLLLGDQNAWAAEKKYLCCIWASAHSVIKALSLFFVLIECTFSSIWTVQPRSDCPASASGLGWTTIRPWLDSPDLGKWKFYRDKETSLSSFVTSEQSFKCSTEHLFSAWPTLLQWRSHAAKV